MKRELFFWELLPKIKQLGVENTPKETNAVKLFGLKTEASSVKP